MTRVLIANRGEVAVRVARTVRELGWESVAIYAEDDALSGHVRAADDAVGLPGRGPAAYLAIDRIAAIAAEHACDLLHPGWGFASEDPRFAELCAEQGVKFAGPRPEILRLFADKTVARELAERIGVPVLPATPEASSLGDVAEFMAELAGPIMIKAISGGGGRGMRAVRSAAELESAYERCRAEALLATGADAVYAEALVERARHIEVQVLGDLNGHLVSLGERDCSIQQHNQKLIEIAPAPAITESQRSALEQAALTLAREVDYDNVGTFEFLLDIDSGRFYFIEANPRLQVEHAVTEMVTGLDLVAAQLQLASGLGLGELGIEPAPRPSGLVLEARINLSPDGDGSGAIEVFQPPHMPGVRFDSFLYSGYTPSLSYDPLLAKIIGYDPGGGLASAAELVLRGLSEMKLTGVGLNVPLLRSLLAELDDAVQSGRLTTGLLGDLLKTTADASNHGPQTISSSLAGLVVELIAKPGAALAAGETVLVVEALKMHHEIAMPAAGRIDHVAVEVGGQVESGDVLFEFTAMDVFPALDPASRRTDDGDGLTPELQQVLALERGGLDSSRPEATARRHAKGHNTIRENLALLCDPDTWLEYGELAAPLGSEESDRAPADGVITGIASINGGLFPDAGRCAVVGHDETVMAGTHGFRGLEKIRRLAERARQQRLPTVIFAEGGGGRSGEPHTVSLSGLVYEGYAEVARLSGAVPVVAVVSRYCFAGNTVLAGVAHAIVATRDTSMGMAGPPMIEGAGLGPFRPEEIGPIDTLIEGGAVDIVVDTDEEAVAAVRRYLGYFQGELSSWDAPDQAPLRRLVPASSRMVFDVRAVLATLFDTDSVLELRAGFGRACVTALARVGGRPVGVIASDPGHLAGAIDADASDKVARFMQLCDAFGLPIVSLIDTPGFMVGPEHERLGLARHTARLFVVGADLTIPIIAVIVRRAYGLGCMGLVGGSMREPLLTVAWPTAEQGGEGLEGSIRVSARSELQAIGNLKEREAVFQRKLADLRATTSAVSHARHFEIDAVIDPVRTREVIMRALAGSPVRWRRGQPLNRTMIDTW